jgi:hypothetical protein
MSSKPEVTKVNSQPYVPKPIKPLAGKLLTLAENTLPSESPQFEAWNDRFALGLTEPQEALRQAGIGNLLGERPDEDLSRDLLRRTVQGMFLRPEDNPFLASQVDALSQDTSHQLGVDINNVRSMIGKAGGGGGSREALMAGTATGTANRGFANAVANLYANNYARERALQQSSTGDLLTMEDRPLNRILQGFELEDIPRQIEQKNLEGDISEFRRGQAERYQPLQIAQSILGQRMGQTTPVIQPGKASPLAGAGGAAQGAGSLLSGYAALAAL